MRRLAIGMLGLVTLAGTGSAEYNYHRPTELLVSLGTQALMVCNELFVSGRSLEQIYEQELKLERMPVVPPGDPAEMPWPDGDLLPGKRLPDGVDAKALEAAWDWTLDAGRTDIPRRSP